MHQPIAIPAADSSSSKSLSLSLWETATRHAIAASPTPAAAVLAAYQHALSIARRLIDAPPPGRAEDCVVALVVSYHNLADVETDHGNLDTAAGHLCCAHEALITLFLDPDRDHNLRQAALRHSRKTHMALISHVSRHGSRPLITRALRTGCLALNVDSPTRH